MGYRVDRNFGSFIHYLLVIVLCLGGIVAIVLPAWQFGLIQSPMENVYRESVSMGWGWWLTVGGIVLSLAGGIGAAFVWPGSTSKLDSR